MADPPAPGKPADPFDGAKANLRETAKWFATSLGAVAAIASAGVSTSRLSELHGIKLKIAVGAGGLGILCLLIAVGLNLRLLTAQEFFVEDLRKLKRIRATIDAHAIDLLPPQVETVTDLLDYRTHAVSRLRDAMATRDLAAFNKALHNYTTADLALAPVTSVAHFLMIKNTFNRLRWSLFVLAILAVVSFSTFVAVIGPKAEAPADHDPAKKSSSDD